MFTEILRILYKLSNVKTPHIDWSFRHVPNIPSKSCGLAEEKKKHLTEWKWFETSVLGLFRSKLHSSLLFWNHRIIMYYCLWKIIFWINLKIGSLHHGCHMQLVKLNKYIYIYLFNFRSERACFRWMIQDRPFEPVASSYYILIYKLTATTSINQYIVLCDLNFNFSSECIS